MKSLNRFIPHLLALVGFIAVALAYFHPVLSGKEIWQSDIVQYTGMAKSQIDYRESHSDEALWSNAAFGGMPTYQLGVKYPHNYVKSLDSVIRFLPRPADYLFLYFIGFYILLVSFKIKPRLAFIGALAFGFSTYLIIIIGAGHNAKAHAIAYMPMVLAGVLMVFRKKYLAGGILTMIAAALEISTNHFQMTYYLLLLLILTTIFYTIHYIKNKDYTSLLKSFGVFAIAGILAIGANATNLLATQEYAQHSSRSKSELTVNPDGTPKTSDNAMSHEYITEYSYGLFESFNLLAPRLIGGGNTEDFGKDSATEKALTSIGVPAQQAKEFAQQAPGYWGDQPIVAAPAYIGAIVIFLFVLALFADNRKEKYLFAFGALFSILFSWGKNFFLTDWLIDHFPLYDKFRAISSIQVIAEICFPLLAILGLKAFLKQSKEVQKKSLKYAGITIVGLLILLGISGTFLTFGTDKDQYLSQMYFGQAVPQFIEALQIDRKSMYYNDLLRSGFFVLATIGILYLYLTEKLKTKWSVLLIGVLIVVDLVGIDRKYVNDDNFVSAQQVKQPFQANPADLEILKDTTNYRVYELQGGFSSARASYFHQSLGGYHAAKPKKIQELYDYLIAQQNFEVFNMLNVKYFIATDQNTGQPIAVPNENANGNAWFVSQIVSANNADEIIEKLKETNTKTTAIIRKEVIDNQQIKNNYAVDSLASVKLLKYEPNKVEYQSNNSKEGLVVFSENYYPHGWTATIDGKESPIFETDYTLRGLIVPAGNHKIVFSFEPEVIKQGSNISLISSIVMLLMVLCGIAYTLKTTEKREKEKSKNGEIS